MKKRKPAMIAIEGIDGAGKTTLIHELCKKYNGEVSIYQRTKKGKQIDKIVAGRLLQKYYMLQVPLYFLLSYKNYLVYKMKPEKELVIMDRCFLSNICYFFPRALHDIRTFRRAMFFEVKMIPDIIFVLDVEPKIGQNRDMHKKSLKWLEDTRQAYLDSVHSFLIKKTPIVVVERNLSVEEKCEIIQRYLQERGRNGN